MLQTLLSAVTAKAVAVAAAGATVAGGAALVVLPDQADNSTAVDAVEAVDVAETPVAPAATVELDAARTDDDLGTTDVEDEGTPPEDTFAHKVHQLQDEYEGEEFGRAVADAAQEHGAERRDAAPIPDEARDRIPDEPSSQGDDAGGDARADAGPPEDIPAGPPADTPAEDRPGR
jgi:hypothetical protein